MSRADDIDDKAAGWILREAEENFGPTQEAARDAWLDADARHRVAYLRLKDSWLLADRLTIFRGTPQREGIAHGFFGRRRVAAGAIAATALAAIFAWHTLRPLGDDFRTPVGARETIALADGSTIELNTDTQLETRVGRAERQVILDRGEAYFQVVHNARVPFVVLAGSRRIVDLGTKFSVRLDGDRVQVLVTEGKVRIEDREQHRAPPVIARRDTEVMASRDDALVSTATPQQLAGKLGWRTGFLVFSDETLAEVTQEFNRYNERKLVIADNTIAAMKIGGTFQATNVDAFATLLEASFGLNVSRTDTEIRISR